MNQQEAKEQLRQAETLCSAQRYEEAWPILEAVYQEYPTSRSVVYQRALCLAGLGRFEEAENLSRELEGQIGADQLSALRNTIAVKREEAEIADLPAAEPAPDIPPTATGGGNVFVVESVFPVTTDETTVTGHVVAGVLRTGDRVSLTSSSGMPLLVPVKRIGSAEAPMKMVREGQAATLLLQVEPHHIVTGARLTADDSSEANAETMVVSDAAHPMEAPAASERDPALDPIEQLLNERRILEARKLLEDYLDAHPSSSPAHRLMARTYLEADDELRDVDKAIEHVQKAYELGGAENPAVLETLAAAMAAKGEAEHGLRFLEKVYGMAGDEEQQQAVAKRIVSYRDRYGLGHVYEFVDTYGDVYFESGDTEAIKKAVEKGTIAEDSRCRRDRVGDWQTLHESFAVDNPDILAPLRKPATSVWAVSLVAGVLGFLAGAVLVALMAGPASQMIVFGGVVGALVAVIGVVIFDMMSKKPAPSTAGKAAIRR